MAPIMTTSYGRLQTAARLAHVSEITAAAMLLRLFKEASLIKHANLRNKHKCKMVSR